MITAYQIVKKYCQDNQISGIKRHEITLIGGFISTHFKRFWGVNQPAEVISQAGFLFTEEMGKPMLVVGYPDCFLEEMLTRIHFYFENKKNQPAKEPSLIKTPIVTQKKERKRIPLPATPVKRYSAKPTNPIL